MCAITSLKAVYAGCADGATPSERDCELLIPIVAPALAGVDQPEAVVRQSLASRSQRAKAYA